MKGNKPGAVAMPPGTGRPNEATITTTVSTRMNPVAIMSRNGDAYPAPASSPSNFTVSDGVLVIPAAHTLCV